MISIYGSNLLNIETPKLKYGTNTETQGVLVNNC